MILSVQGNSGNFTRLLAEKLNYLGPVDLTQYFVVSYNITDDENTLRQSTNGFSGVRVNFLLSRRLLNQILTTFLPTFAICVVAFTTNYYQVN